MIEIRALTRSFRGGKKALDAVDLDIPAGEIFALLGPNGAGKTTLIRCLIGSVIPDSGQIRIGADDPQSGERAKIACMPQTPSYPAWLTPRDLMDFLEKIDGPAPRRQQLEQELGVVSFQDKPFGTLSHGMKQKVNIVQCFGFTRKLSIIDEPTAGLDPGTAWKLKELVRERQKEGGTVLFTSHVMSEVEELASSMGMLVEGKLLFTGVPSEFIKEKGATRLEEAVRIYWAGGRE